MADSLQVTLDLLSARSPYVTSACVQGLTFTQEQVDTCGPPWPLLSIHAVLCTCIAVQTSRDMWRLIKAQYNSDSSDLFLKFLANLPISFLSHPIYLHTLPTVLDFSDFFCHWYCYYFRQHTWVWNFLFSAPNWVSKLGK